MKRARRMSKKELRFFIEQLAHGTIDEATRLTVDSVHGDSVRLLTTRLKRPVLRERGYGDLVSFNSWEDEEERDPLNRREAARELSSRTRDVIEGKVFLQFEGRTVDVTPLVRDEAKKTYHRLTSREGQVPAARSTRSR